MPTISFILLTQGRPPTEPYKKIINYIWKNKWVGFDVFIPPVLLYKSIIYRSKGLGALSAISFCKLLEAAINYSNN